MKKVAGLLTVLILIGAAVAQAPFKSYTSPDTKFSIKFPGTPNVSAPVQQKTTEGDLFTERHYAVADDGAYVLLTADYPFATNKTTLSGIPQAQASACGAAQANIRSNTNVQGRPALLFTIDCPGTQEHAAISLTVQAVADGNRLYRLIYGSGDKPDGDRLFQFLSSFHIN